MSTQDQNNLKRKRGRPPGPGGPKASRPKDAPADHPAGVPMVPADDDDIRGDGDDVATSPGDIPDDRRIRKNGSPVPLVVQKLAAIVINKGIRKVLLESPEGGDIGENRLYHWRMKAGEPSTAAIIRLANFLDVSLEYLIDDNIPVTHPAPKKWETSTYKVLDAANSLGLDIEDVERYLMVVKLAITFGVDPERAMKMIATGSVERRDYPHGGGRPAHNPDGFR